MIPTTIQELVGQRLENWTIVQWYSTKIAGQQEAAYFATLTAAENKAADSRYITEVMVLTNGHRHFLIGSGKRIDRSEQCRAADNAAREQLDLCRDALTKLTPRERALLGYPLNPEEAALAEAIAKMKRIKLTTAERQLLNLPAVTAEVAESAQALRKLLPKEVAVIKRIFKDKRGHIRLAEINSGVHSPPPAPLP